MTEDKILASFRLPKEDMTVEETVFKMNSRLHGWSRERTGYKTLSHYSREPEVGEEREEGADRLCFEIPLPKESLSKTATSCNDWRL